jgi:hypothetical protein
VFRVTCRCAGEGGSCAPVTVGAALLLTVSAVVTAGIEVVAGGCAACGGRLAKISPIMAAAETSVSSNKKIEMSLISVRQRLHLLQKRTSSC